MLDISNNPIKINTFWKAFTIQFSYVAATQTIGSRRQQCTHVIYKSSNTCFHLSLESGRQTKEVEVSTVHALRLASGKLSLKVIS